VRCSVVCALLACLLTGAGSVAARHEGGSAGSAERSGRHVMGQSHSRWRQTVDVWSPSHTHNIICRLIQQRRTHFTAFQSYTARDEFPEHS